ncbi:hypothetical protein [Paraliobacillus sediminis]|uniref:hypothetical protein n=1 Tax=Paraliobacillus sediminis TaxID=1885916 RepID=UPI000E3B5E90|nr:hypothetical protein [Paraliobacillus sediminis]
MDQKLKKLEYVWYASYGSNLNRDRFLCYIKGGKPEGSSKVEVGCKDKSLPLKEATYKMNLPLYFAKSSVRWQKQGVAFIGLKKDGKYLTYSRKYLITVDQFLDVVKQENNQAELDIDLAELIKNGVMTYRDSWYGTLLYLGDVDGYPIVTFTADWDLDVPFRKPSEEYLTMIIKGLRLTLELEKDVIVDYISSKPGVINHYKRDAIEKLIN